MISAATIRTFLLALLSGVALLLVLIPVPAKADLCKDPRIVIEMRMNPATGVAHGAPTCRPETADFRDAAGIHRVDVAVVLRSASFTSDVPTERHDVFVRLPGDELVNLGDSQIVPPRTLWPLSEVVQSLQIDAAEAGGLCCIKETLLYDHAIERHDGRLCGVYRMKPPFRGVAFHCDGREVVGEVGYGDGIISWKQARDISCKQLAKDTGKSCGGPYNGPLATRLTGDPGGLLYFDTEVRSLVRVVTELATPTSTPVHYEIHRYRVDLVGGNVSLLERRDLPVAGE